MSRIRSLYMTISLPHIGLAIGQLVCAGFRTFYQKILLVCVGIRHCCVTLSLCRIRALLLWPTFCQNPSPSTEWESCIMNHRVYILQTDFRMLSSRGGKRRARKRRAPARFDEMSTMVGNRNSRGTDDLGTTPRRASSTTTSRSVAKSARSPSGTPFTHITSSIVTPPPIISAVATSDPVYSPCRPAVISIRSRSASASTRMTSAATLRRSTSSAPFAWRASRRVPSPVVDEADYIPYEDAVSSDGEVLRCDDMHQQIAEMGREMVAMQNLVNVMASTAAQPIVGPSTSTAQPIAGPSSATIQSITGPSTYIRSPADSCPFNRCGNSRRAAK